MGEPDTESKHYKAGWGGLVVNVILVGMGIAMVSVGDTYRGEEYCKNNVDLFLFWGGIVTIVANASGLLGGCARQLALRDGRISCAEGCCLGLLGCFTGMASLLEIVTLIWGSVVVFSSWPNWTSTDMTSADYCMDTPMLFAFILQIIRWVLIGIFIILGCFACCWGCYKHVPAAMEQARAEQGHAVRE